MTDHCRYFVKAENIIFMLTLIKHAWVYATDSNNARSRLYRMGINKYFEIVATGFDIMGEHQNEWERYEYGKDYQAFAVRRKNSKFDS